MEKQVFVKLEKYREIVENLTNLKISAVKLKNQLAIYKKIKEIEHKIIEKNEKILEEINQKIDELLLIFTSKEVEKLETEKMKKEVEDILNSLKEIRESLEAKV